MASTILHSRGARTRTPAAEPVGARVYERQVGAAFTGLAAVLVGAWGALAGYIGPYFAFRPVDAHVWAGTWENGLLHLLPGAVAAAAGLMLLAMGPARRSVRGGAFLLPAILLLAAGAWFVIGPVAWPTFHSGTAFMPATATRNLLNIACASYAPGLVLVMLGGMALKAALVPALAVEDPYTPASAVPATGGVAAGEGAVAGRPVVDAERAGAVERGPVAAERTSVGEPATVAGGGAGPVAGGRPMADADRAAVADAEVGGAAAQRRGLWRRRT